MLLYAGCMDLVFVSLDFFLFSLDYSSVITFNDGNAKMILLISAYVEI